jgi:SPP1 gp7 family putative phage head morphogenesis protein
MRGIKDGLSEASITKLIREDMDTATERWIATMVRTKTTEIYNSTRKTVWETDPLIKQIVEAYQFSAVLDERTTDVCRSLDGKVFERGGFVDRITPPLHFNCRSLLVPITKFEDYKASKEPSLESLVERGGGLIQA